MPWKIDHDDTAYTIHQSGRAMRWVLVGLAVVAVALAVDPPASASLGARLFPLFGWLAIAYAGSSLTITIDTRFDRSSQRVTIQASRWFARRWSVDAPLSDVEGVEVDSEAAGNRRQIRFLRVRLRDGRKPTVWMPMVLADLPKHSGELETWLARANARV